jgi:hypothetical protein
VTGIGEGKITVDKGQIIPRGGLHIAKALSLRATPAKARRWTRLFCQRPGAVIQPSQRSAVLREHVAGAARHAPAY